MSKRAVKAVRIGLVGFGNVGRGVARLLVDNAGVIEARLGFPLRLQRVATRSPEKGGDDARLLPEGVTLDDDVHGLLSDPQVDIVVELIGGVEQARAVWQGAFKAGKPVVTANKALLAEHGGALLAEASACGVGVVFEAGVGGGIPILRALREGLAANRIESLHGILNGTTNYVLTEMERSGEAVQAVIARARELGYAEADPSFDVEGHDVAHKLALLTALAFGVTLDYRQIPTEGIMELEPADLAAAREFGLCLKLLGLARPCSGPRGECIDVRVHPALIPEGRMLAHVHGVMNAVVVHGDAVGETLFYGAGAGALPTAGAVVADLMEIARELRARAGEGESAEADGYRTAAAAHPPPFSYQPENLKALPLLPQGELSGRYYLVFSMEDRAGVLARVTSVLGEHGIGIDSLVQKSGAAAEEGAEAALAAGDAGVVPVRVLTHPQREAALRAALDKIDALPGVAKPTRMIRIVDDC